MTRSAGVPALVALCTVGVGCGATGATEAPVQVVELQDIDTLAAGLEFGDIREIVTSGTDLWVLDRHAPHVTLLPAAADTVVRFGSAGEGPAELGRPVALGPRPDGVDVWDVGLGKRVRYALDGDLSDVASLSDDRSGWIRSDMDRVSHLDPWRIRTMGARTAFTRLPSGMTQPTDYGRGFVVLGDADLGSPTAVVSHADHLPRDERALGQFPAMPLWDACSETLVVWSPRGARVEWRDAAGEVVDSVVVPDDAGTVTLEGIEGFLRRMARLELGSGAPSEQIDFGALAREMRPAFGEVATPFVDLRCGRDGSAWLRRFDLRADPLGAGDRWLRVSPTAPATELRFPSSFEPHVFGADSVIGVLEAERGQVLSMWKWSTRRSR